MAITFDNSSFSFQADPYNIDPGTNADRLMFIAVLGFGPDNADRLTGVTFNSVSATRVGWMPVSNRSVYLYYLINPDSGTHAIGTTHTHTWVNSIALCYSGCRQSSVPDASNTNTATGTSITTSVTTIADNCWAIVVEGDDVGSADAGTGTVNRSVSGSGAYVGDTNAALTPAGSHSMTVNNGSGNLVTIMASFAPVGAGGGPSTTDGKIIFSAA